MVASSTSTMRIKDRAEYASKPKPLTFAPETPLLEAVSAMCEKNYGSVIVVDPEDKVIGVVTERDLMRKVVNTERVPSETTLSEIMTSNPRMANENDDIADWLRIMSNERFRRLPVVDGDGRIKAVFTQGDFVSYTWPELMHQARELARSSVARNWPIVLIGGGLMLYTIAMIVVLQFVR